MLQSERNVAGGYPVLDENGKVGTAQLNYAGGTGTAGIIKIFSNGHYGLKRLDSFNNGLVGTAFASDNEIDSRKTSTDITNDTKNFKSIVPNNLDYAVRSVLPNVTEIPAATSDYSLVDSSATTNNHSHVYSHAPTTAPTYRLPQVTNTAIAHYIELTVDFTSVQTYSFLDNAGEPIVPLFTPSIATGDVYTFKMEYSAIKDSWLIYPQKQGAVADDFVMRGEVGAANGVAGLDENARVTPRQLPLSTTTTLGAVMVDSGHGTRMVNNWISTQFASISDIASRSNQYRPIVPTSINATVTAALTDANHITLNDEQKATAQEVFGVPAPLLGTTAPTTSTVGVIGQLYVDTVTSKTYHCTAIANTGTESEPVMEYTWTDDVNANGGIFRGGIQVNNSNNYANTRIRAQGHIDGGFQCNAGQSAYGAIAIGYYATALSDHGAASFGVGTNAAYQSQLVTGKYTVDKDAARLTGNGVNGNNRRNIEELSWDGDLYIAGGHQ